jgi:hypothetical protein
MFSRTPEDVSAYPRLKTAGIDNDTFERRHYSPVRDQLRNLPLCNVLGPTISYCGNSKLCNDHNVSQACETFHVKLDMKA